jgi:hypothetical protein
LLAAAIETAFLGLVFLLMNSPSGADNPVPLLIVALLQLPSSLIVILLIEVISSEHGLTTQALWLYAALMFVGQTVLLGVWLRKPWRRESATLL